MFSSGSIARWAKIMLVGLLFGLVIWYCAPPLMLWFVPTRVPEEIARHSEEQLPDSFNKISRHQAVSPLQWRVTHIGHFADELHPRYQVVYLQNRLTGRAEVSVDYVQGRHQLFPWLQPVSFTAAFFLFIYLAAPRLLGQPCPHCGSKPFSLISEEPLKQEPGPAFATYRGHYRCSKCGLNKITVYTGSRKRNIMMSGDLVREMGFGSLFYDESDEEDLSAWGHISWLRKSEDEEWFEDS